LDFRALNLTKFK